MSDMAGTSTPYEPLAGTYRVLRSGADGVSLAEVRFHATALAADFVKLVPLA